MKYGARVNGGASLTLALAKALPTAMRGNVIELTKLHTEPEYRNQGHARDLLAQVCFEADLSRKFLLLNVKPASDCPMTAKQLADFYLGFGFMPLPGPEILMTRPFTGAMGIGLLT